MLITSLTLSYALVVSALCAVIYRAGIRIGAERLKALQEKQKKKSTPVNFVYNIVFPEFEDPRWQYLQDPSRFQLGNVWIALNQGKKKLRVGPLEHYIRWTEDTAEETQYCNAVVDAWCNRLSFESIEGVALPTKDPQLQLKGV